MIDPETVPAITAQLISRRDAGGAPIMMLDGPTFVGLDGDTLTTLPHEAVIFDAAAGLRYPEVTL